MNVAICDNNIEFISRIEEMLQEYESFSGKEILVNSFTDYSEIENCLDTFDLFFLDFDMEDVNGVASIEKSKTDGMTFARKIRREYGNKKEIIFITAFPDFVYESFEVRAFRFLKKPLDKDLLFKALNDYCDNPSGKLLTIPTKTGKYVLNSDDIIYIEVLGKNTTIYCNTNTLTFKKPMLYFENLLCECGFFKVHKSYLVNVRKIEKFDYNSVTLKNGVKLTLSQRKYPLLCEMYFNCK